MAESKALPEFLSPSALLKRGEIMLAMGVIGILVVLIFPLPPWLLDLLLAISITLGVLILMVSLFIAKPLDLSSFPTILLITTLLRLALNMASTRLILSHGHEGTDAAGAVIQAFGNFMMGGNFAIGVIVFAILVLVNFMVITKGSGRIAEVSARFTLDAMPGKQMAIDADLSSGLIDEATARSRRKELEDESNFFGSMDGAAKFVRGDAMAGIVITFVNILGGLGIGMLQHDMEASEALSSYTILTVGDGLVSQIPALLVSTASGLMVSKAGAIGSTDKALFKQLSNFPAALGLSAFLMAVMSFLPGIPTIPFLAVASMVGYLAYSVYRQQESVKAAEAAVPQAPPAPTIDPVVAALQMDIVRLELGYSLLALINNQTEIKLTDQIKALRRQLASELGFVLPSVRIQDNLQLPNTTYVLRVKESEAGRGEVKPDSLLVMDPRGEKISLPGEATVEPTFGLPAMWVSPAARDEALAKGCTVVDPATVITTHLTEIIKDNIAELLSYSETQKLLEGLDKPQQKIVSDLIPDKIPLGGVQRILQNLLGERISIRDLPTILEAILEATTYTRNITQITEHVRARLARQISETNTSVNGFIPLVSLSPQWEQAFLESLVQQGEERTLSMAPSKLQEFIGAVRQTYDRFAMMGEMPVLLTSASLRPYVRSIIERFRPSTVVMSHNEVHPKAKIKTLGQI